MSYVSDTPDVEKPLPAVAPSPGPLTPSNDGSNVPVNDQRSATNSRKDNGFLNHSRKKLLLIGLAIFILLILVVVLPVALTVGRHKKNGPNSSNGNSNGNPDLPVDQPDGAITGGDGSKIKLENGTTITYHNKFGGYWYYDPKNPFTNGARCQSWVPALNETWRWGVDTIRGVNLGGWFVLEPFITPALFEKYAPAVEDEYGLMQAKIADGTVGDLEEHYKTFITEEDFAKIAAAGLNWIRLPVGFWAIQTYEGEPFLEGVSWKYVVKAIEWARKYGLRINLDLHAVPGSQNGWNHSGWGRGAEAVGWLHGVMGIANAQRSLDYIRIITEYISQPQYAPVVPMFGIVNEPRISTITRPPVEDFYFQAYSMIRDITGVGEGKGPYISIHDGFESWPTWNNFMNGADRLALDVHPYFAFDGANNNPLASYVAQPCSRWASDVNTTQSTFGVITAGEWSVAINDCGLYVTGVGGPGPAYGGNCDQWNQWEAWDDTTKANLKQFALASMDALQNWFFWTWKIGPSSVDNMVRAPFWSYQLGLDQGWMPDDPRDALGACAALGQPPTNPFGGAFPPWATGGAGADQFPQATLTWPPATLASIPLVAYLPTYTPTGVPIITLQGPRATGADYGDGWFNAADNTPMMTPAAGCVYPTQYLEQQLPQPVVPFCGGPVLDIPVVPTTTATTPGVILPTTTTDPLIPIIPTTTTVVVPKNP